MGQQHLPASEQTPEKMLQQSQLRLQMFAQTVESLNNAVHIYRSMAESRLIELERLRAQLAYDRSDPSAAIIEELTQSLREREALLLKKDQQLQELRVQADASARNAEMMRERLHAREASVEGLRHMETKAQALSTNAQESQEKISQVSENNAREETLAACTVQGMPLMEVVCDRRSLNAEGARQGELEAQLEQEKTKGMVLRERLKKQNIRLCELEKQLRVLQTPISDEEVEILRSQSYTLRLKVQELQRCVNTISADFSFKSRQMDSALLQKQHEKDQLQSRMIFKLRSIGEQVCEALVDAEGAEMEEGAAEEVLQHSPTARVRSALLPEVSEGESEGEDTEGEDTEDDEDQHGHDVVSDEHCNEYDKATNHGVNTHKEEPHIRGDELREEYEVKDVADDECFYDRDDIGVDEAVNAYDGLSDNYYDADEDAHRDEVSLV